MRLDVDIFLRDVTLARVSCGEGRCKVRLQDDSGYNNNLVIYGSQENMLALADAIEAAVNKNIYHAGHPTEVERYLVAEQGGKTEAESQTVEAQKK